MDTTLNNMVMKKPDPSAEEVAAKQLVRLARGQILSLTGPERQLNRFTKCVLDTVLNMEMTEHLGYEKNRVPPGRELTNVRNGTRAKSVLTGASGTVDLKVPRDRASTFEPVIVRKRQGRLVEVDEAPLPLYAPGCWGSRRSLRELDGVACGNARSQLLQSGRSLAHTKRGPPGGGRN